jgi:hypothetical protein
MQRFLVSNFNLATQFLRRGLQFLAEVFLGALKDSLETYSTSHAQGSLWLLKRAIGDDMVACIQVGRWLSRGTICTSDQPLQLR